MAKVARLVGMEVREYKKDGKDAMYVGLHLMYLDGATKDVLGSKVESVACPRGVDHDKLEIGKLYELEYEIYEFRGELRARLQDLTPVEE